MYKWMMANSDKLVALIVESRSLISPEVDLLLTEHMYQDQKTKKESFRLLKYKLSMADPELAQLLLGHI